ncbi:hypothetical protein G7066_03500 [Leucobacter coleopterorum]|uniref:Uncharacterized protein n=1 Tax=Leucobacter coleopterorum TaxID=2714933 RepID=A0ABX6JYX5_9MICO|nr:hypothetical protein [Leucobacter coleopterorum]QIM17975.1 hypothetical protein G7066_03500 [Leucobacter coleopterorum]
MRIESFSQHKDPVGDSGVNRRTLLGVTFGVAAFSLFHAPSSAHARAEENAVSAELSIGESYGFAQDWSGALPALIPLTLLLRPTAGFEELSEGTVDISWASSVAAVHSDSVVIVAGDSLTLTKHVITEHAGISTMSFPLSGIDKGSSAEELVCALPLRSRIAYPNDQIAGEYTPVARISIPEQPPIEIVATSSLSARPGEVWGSELSIIWASVSGKPEDQEIRTLPQSVRLSSIGPGAVPAGASLTVESAPGGEMQLSVSSAYWDNDETSEVPFEYFEDTNPDKTTAKFVIQAPIPAGQSIRLDFAPIDDALKETLGEQLLSCVVSMFGPENAELSLIRQTGNTSHGWTKETQ